MSSEFSQSGNRCTSRRRVSSATDLALTGGNARTVRRSDLKDWPPPRSRHGPSTHLVRENGPWPVDVLVTARIWILQPSWAVPKAIIQRKTQRHGLGRPPCSAWGPRPTSPHLHSKPKPKQINLHRSRCIGDLSWGGEKRREASARRE